MLGGGHNPYSGLLGLTCEYVVEYEFVTLDGEFVKASKDENQELFWASCGGGGAHFGIMHRFTIRTHDAAVFDKNVYFRYEWDLSVAGEVLSKWLDYDQDGGKTWFRLEINSGTGIYGYGVCWDAGSLEECEDRLDEAEFFRVGADARFTHIAQASTSVAEFQMFIGPAGKWGWRKPTTTPREAFVGKGWDEATKGLHRLYSSAYWSLHEKPSVALLQRMTEICSRAATAAVDFTLCQWNPWRGKQREGGGDHAFAHRRFDVFTELIGAASEADPEAGMAELKALERAVKDLTGKFIGGIYVSYPEFDLEPVDYSYLYWGQSLPRLAALKAQMDPDGMFHQIQPMPSGAVKCPGKMVVAGAPAELLLSIDGYAAGQRPGMHLHFSMPTGCTVASAVGATVVEADATGGSGIVYDAAVHSGAPFAVAVNGTAACKPTLVAINSVSCNDDYQLASNQPRSAAVKTSKDEPAELTDKPEEAGDKKGCFPASATVETLARGVVAMRDLAVGDAVRAASGRFSPVFFFSHRSPAVSGANFVTVTTCGGGGGAPAAAAAAGERCGAASLRRLTVTDNHYLVTATDGLRAAGALRSGDALAAGRTVMSVVPAGKLPGLYNPHTLAVDDHVAGVVASCYTTAVHPTLARWLLAPLAVLFRAAHTTPALKGVMDLARPHLGRLAGPPVLL
jgi:hypothetical protein